MSITTVGRRPLFANLYLGRLVVRALIRVEREELATTLAFVVMPDHLHWLMQLGKESELSDCVGSMKSQSSWMINRHSETTGSNWQRGFYDRAVRRNDDLLHIANYIVANPLRSGLVSNIGDYALWDTVWV